MRHREENHAAMNCTLVIPFYRNSLMLARQLAEVSQYPAGWRVIIVDDGSPEPAEHIVREWIRSLPDGAPLAQAMALRLYRIDVDIPWNREGARNLASRECETDWLVHVDIDHILPAPCASALLRTPWEPRSFYRFPRFRVGRADDTRNKDRIPREQDFGEIHPHIDSYLCTKEVYWKAGGYNEDFSGTLGGGAEFLRRLNRTAEARIAPADVHLHVYTRTAIADASDLHCSRDTRVGKDIERQLRADGMPKPSSWLRFPWHRVL